MEEWQIKLIIGIIGAVVAAGGGGVLVHKMYAEKLEAKTIESESRLHKLREAKIKVSTLTQEKQRLTVDLKSLKGKYDVLLEDYRRATRADGLTYDGPSLEASWQEALISTGDKIRFKLSTASLFLQIARVTHDGPIARAQGAVPRLVDPSFLSGRDGEFAYLLRLERQLHLQVSGRASADGYLSGDLSDLEDVFVVCQAFDVKKQTCILRFRKCLPGR
jgi:hypothetical protein